MTGKDIFVGLSYIDGKYIAEADAAPETAKVRTLRRPLQIAALVALMLLLVGCAVVYLLNMQEIKLGEQEVSYDVYDYDPRTGEAVSYVGQDSRKQQVLTLAGLNNSPTSKAAREWYAFLETYDPDGEIQKSVWGSEPDFGDEYYGYGLYSQDMKDKLDEILDKYDLKLKGKRVEFKTDKLMFKALGMENVLNPGSEAVLDIRTADYYENGNFNLHFLYDLPGDGDNAIHSQGWLYYRNKACFIPDTAVLTEAEWEEWNYTTAAGDQVLIVRSEEAASAWFFSDLPEYTASLQISTIQEMYEETEDGVPVARFRQLTREQLERIADSIDFTLEPRLVEGWETMEDGAVTIGEEINGYRIDVESAFTDGYRYRIVLGVTAPDGIALTDPDDHTVRLAPGDGVFGSCQEDGDGLLNTCHYILEAHERPEDGSLPYPQGSVIPVYWEDMYLTSFDFENNQSQEKLLAEGCWQFSVTLENADIRTVQLVREPVKTKIVIGWDMQGNDVFEDTQITSFSLSTFSASIRCDLEGAAPDFCFNEARCLYAVMLDGSRVVLMGDNASPGTEYFTLEEPIDLDQVACVQMADGTVIPMPGVDEATVAQAVAMIPVEGEADTMPTIEGGVELLSEAITIKNLAGFVTDVTGDVEPLYEYFTLKSFVLGPNAALALDKRAMEEPGTEIQVYMTDGSQITLRNTGNGRNADNDAFSVFTADKTIDLSKVDHLQLPDGTILSVPIE